MPNTTNTTSSTTVATNSAQQAINSSKNCKKMFATQLKYCKMRRYNQHLCAKHYTPLLFLMILIMLSSLLVLANCDNLIAQAPTAQGVLNVQQPYYSSSASAASSKNSRAKRYLLGKERAQRFYASPSNANIAQTAAQLSSFNLVAGAREDICTGHCTCAKLKNVFTNITCDYQRNRKLNAVFDANLKVPSDATAIRIILAADTNFVLQRGFFANNKVNSFIIEGVQSQNDQVEIATEAFMSNRGPFPDIQILNVFSVILRSRAFSAGECKLTVRNANDLILYEDSFKDTSINGHFVGINDLRITEKAFNSAKARLRIENSNIDNLYRFEASLHEISFINCTIGTINGGTFDVNNIKSIRFENCRIDAIKSRAITEKLFSEHVSITGAKIGFIESEAIYGSGITELLLTRNNIDTIHANAIHVTAVNVTIAQNNIKHLDNNWLRVQQWSNITVAKNQFGVFGRMLLEETTQQVTCRFDGNSLTKPLPGSLDIPNHHCILREVTVNLPCRCNLQWLQELSAHDLRSETYCTIDDKLSVCFNASTFNTMKYLHEVCDEHKTTLDCVANRNLKKIDGRFFTVEELERRDQFLPRTIVMIAAGALLLIALMVATGILIYRLCCARGKSTQAFTMTNVPHVSDHLHNFSTEDRHIIDQTLQLMQKKYPKIFKKVEAQTELLLQSNLSDKKCRKAVIQIVNLLNNIPNAADDFAIFNNVLAQHLQPQMPSAPPQDPIYTEPGLTGIDDDIYMLNTAQGPYAVCTAAPTTVLLEHIYAEPNCAQQPLLRNDYSSPVDINIDVNDPYMEPVHERGRNLPHAAYAVSQPFQQQYALPGLRNHHHRLPSIPAAASEHATHLPDVLNQSQGLTQITYNEHSKPLTNVQKMAQDLQNMPKFHLNQPRPQNLHLVAPPLYTAPDKSHKLQAKTPAVPLARLASPEAIDDCEMDMRGAAALPPDSGSDHSGGSNETVKIDDVIEYVDA